MLRFSLLAVSALCAASSPNVSVLLPVEPVERELAAGGSHIYEADLGAGPWLLEVDQHDIDVIVEVSGPDGESLMLVDSPFDRRGTESALVEVVSAGVHHVEILSREPTGADGLYVISIDPLQPHPRRLDAERAMTAAAGLYAEGTADTRRQAMAWYLRAYEAFRVLGEERAAARALYASAVLHRLDQDNAGALELDRQALLLFRSLEDRAFLANTVNEIGLNQRLLGETARARTSFTRALELHKEAGHRWGEAVASANLCLMDLMEGDLRSGAECYAGAIPLLDEVRAADLAATALSNVGRAYDLLGEPEKALESYGAALEPLRVLGERTKQGRVFNNLGVLHRELGELQEALVSYGEALTRFQESGDRRWQARVLGNVGLVYDRMHQPLRAEAHFRQALALWRQVGDPRGEASALVNLGWVHRGLGDLHAALSDFDRALALWRSAGGRREEARVLTHLGRLSTDLGDFTVAAGFLDQAVVLLAEMGDRIGEAAALWAQGQTFDGLARPEDALTSLNRALALSRGLGSRYGEARSHFLLARTLRGRPNQDAAALAHVETAIEIVEADRDRLRPPALRASYASEFHDAYELKLELLVEAHRRDPGARRDLAALELSERARARTLLELLLESGTDPYEGGDPELLRRRKSLRRRLDAKAERASRASTDAGRRSVLGAEQADILRELDVVEARLRERRPMARPRSVTAAEIQALLDDDTMLLTYALGEERSFLWQVTAGAVRLHALPGRDEIEDAARRVHESLRHYDPAERRRDAEAAAALSRLLLGPLDDLHAGRYRRIALLPDGALWYVPFGALPLPGSDDGTFGPSVVETYEVVYLASASVLAAQRRSSANRAPPPHTLAVLADPVFDRRDPRLAGKTLPPAASGGGELRFERLPATRKEAEALVALAPPGQVLSAFGFEADRDRLLGGHLSAYRFIHFATHGVIDTQSPALSGLVLSLYDEEGRPKQGFLRLHDVYGLRLGAELVVLSGCRTALGRRMRGEGIWGLTRGFLSAGAERVLASLWQVEDRASAELMRRFYSAMWSDGATPAAALRRAKLSLRRERRWRDPHFWAGWVLEGDWQQRAAHVR